MSDQSSLLLEIEAAVEKLRQHYLAEAARKVEKDILQVRANLIVAFVSAANSNLVPTQNEPIERLISPHRSALGHMSYEEVMSLIAQFATNKPSS